MENQPVPPAADLRLDRMLRLLVLRSYPRLRRVPLRISWGAADDFEDELLSYSVQKDHYQIRVNDELRGAPLRVLQGGIAHELCHIDADLKLRGYQRQFAWSRYGNSPWSRMREERATDRRVIELGYARQLLALVRYAHKLDYSFSRKQGLLYAEIHRAMKLADISD
jgi:hypothetical protein